MRRSGLRLIRFAYFLMPLAVLGLPLIGCASLNSVSVTPVPAHRSDEVSSEAHRWIILGFNFDNDYVDQVASDLKSKCPEGKISGILTKDELYDYFLFLVLKRKVTATGYCEKYGRVAGEGSKR